MLGKERLGTKNIIKRETKTVNSLKVNNITQNYLCLCVILKIPFHVQDDDDDDSINDYENTENVIDNDDGEDLLLKKLAEESIIAKQQKHESSGDADDDEIGSSSRKFLFFKLFKNLKKTESKISFKLIIFI